VSSVAEVIVLELGGERFALPTSAVCEILPLGNLTPVPTAPPSVCGVVQVRGQVIPVLDLGPPTPPERPARSARVGAPLVIVEPGSDGARYALIVERVHEVENAERSTVKLLPVADAIAELKRQVNR
jgi:purine-binding chemotaxis protein CheW